MTGEGIAAIILAIATLLTAFGALVVSLRNGQKVNDAAVAAESAKIIAADKGAAAVAAAEAAKLAALSSNALLVETNGEIRELGKRVDGRLSEVLALTKAKALAEGRLEGQAAEKQRQTDDIAGARGPVDIAGEVTLTAKKDSEVEPPTTE
jgi:ribosomal protein RSM22 (predicted rRNA methylase)